MVFLVMCVKGNGVAWWKPHTAFKSRCESMPLVQWINLDLKSAEPNHAGH
jgi:hypothetical protein